MTATDKPWVEPSPIDTEKIRARQLAAKDALAEITIGWWSTAPTKVAVEATLSDTLMLVAAIERIRMTHQEVRWEGGSVCVECVTGDGSSAEYPCTTIKAIDP